MTKPSPDPKGKVCQSCRLRPAFKLLNQRWRCEPCYNRSAPSWYEKEKK